ncbi:bifunctional alpha/beta hydrolase/class I SAM-dependent methyltransferase [Thaumasiovibrio subtropicus]|uniref:bifunctional alpha/beta hydrolase/class I SAM-dependent methyltransferase n=1 Tax=Thaumasiovibrio subtropicus TaxID=1891207 RepID=UPI00131D2AA6|nr:bifunctional alpha/beta hydrolase/class I SAM-dependent methyltransferase [Thaumasiovibrio subtropicus]
MESKQHFYAEDGTKLIYRTWTPETPRHRVIVMLHRGHEHSGRMAEMAAFYCQQGYLVYAWDARGNGESEGERDAADHFTDFGRDLQTFMALVETQSGIRSEETVLIASSMGAVIAASWLHDYAPSIRGLILATAAFDIRLYVPFAMPMLKLARKLGVMPTVSSYVKSKLLTQDRREQFAYNDDPLISSSIATDLLIDTHYTAQRLLDDAGAITTPIMMLCAGRDFVVSRRAQRRFYERLGSSMKQWRYYPDTSHAIFHDWQRPEVFADCLRFIETLFERELPPVLAVNDDQQGYSRDRADAVRLPSYHPEYGLTRLSLHTLGKLSEGIRLGHKTGFDSGQTLDYVYRNQAAGRSFLGKMIDRTYLNSPGWVGIRRRKQLLESLLTRYLPESATASVLDIAAGNGRYLLDKVASQPALSAELRDYAPENIAVMTQAVEERGLTERVRVVEKDAFDLASYDQPAQFQLAVVSGLFELFTDNEPLSVALSGIATQLQTDGILLYTNQPWHPQQTLIAKTLTNHRGQPWFMRCRTQAEMDQLVMAAGFEKVATYVEPGGMFTVSVARLSSTSSSEAPLAEQDVESNLA